AIPPESSEGISLAAPRSPTASSFIITVLCNNGAGSWVCSRSELFMTHPPLDKRIEALRTGEYLK
ncbi:hypothetical protein ACUOFC_37125, partial [Escherichia sp. TWPC-MK]